MTVNFGVSVNRRVGAGPGSGSICFFKECCFRVKFRVRLDTNGKPNPKTAFFRKKIEPDPDPDPAFY